ncbi:MAG: CHAD domain-containing protein [Alphaproteobacteria bacterium]
MGEEFELKLAVAPEDVERFRRQPILRALRERPASTKHLVSTYYDTPRFELRHKAVALRVRQIGHERIQSIKREAAAGKNRLARQEWERSIDGDRPDLSALDDPELRRLISPHNERGELAPVFVTDVQRQVWPLRMGSSQIECALDVGEIKANGKSEPVCEVELELKSGAPARLFELARRLHAAVPLRIEPTSKAERGYCLASGAAPAPRKATAVELDSAMSVREAIATAARACMVHIVGNADCADQGKDPEGVHQLRVGLRRLRAALSVFGEALPERERKALAGQLRWLQREMGPAREWDVFIDGTLKALAKRLADGGALESVSAAAEAARAAAYERARAALADPRYTDLLLQLEAWLDRGLVRAAVGEAGRAAAELLDTPVLSFSAEVLRARHAKAHKLGAKLKKLDEAHLHEFRIRVKKLRYAIEFFRNLYTDKAAKRYIASLKELQDVLGTANDALVAHDLIPQIEAGAGPQAARALGQLEGWCLAAVKSDRRRLQALWQDFAKLKPFWKTG